MSRPGEHPCPLVPVLGQSGCAGHLLRGAKGFVAFDAADKQIGAFENIGVGTQALLDLSINGDR